MPKEITELDNFKRQFELAMCHPELTRCKMEKSWTINFPTVDPEPINLDVPTQFGWIRGRDGRLMLRKIPKVGYLVPFLASLKQQMSIKFVYDHVLCSFEENRQRQSNPCEELNDFWAGSFIQSTPLYIEQQGAVIAIQLYYDEVEPANSLGSKKGQHKIGVFYWTLLNLPPQARSNLRSINLLGIINSKLLKQCGVKAFLKPFLNDLEKLEKGVKLGVRDDPRTWFGMLGNIVGDMPASNMLGGFKEGSGFANKPCRICLVGRKELDLIEQHERDCNVRVKAIHAVHVNKITSPNNSVQERNSFSVEYGIVSESNFCALSYFDPTKCLPHDVMHVFYEGLLNLETRLVLNRLVLIDGIVDIETINIKLETFRSGREYTKPPKIRFDDIKNEKKLSFSSSEMQSLTDILPFVLSEYCSCESNPYYANYMLLVRIAASVCCFSFTEEKLKLLEFDILVHNTTFISLYPNNNVDFPTITPKLHALIHLPNQIRLFGPARYFWCFRYESKNAPLKKTMRRICNFRNIPFSIANQVQKLMGLDVRQDGEGDFYGFSHFKIKITKTETKKVSETNRTFWSKTLNESNILHYESFKIAAKNFNISGRICKKGSVFLRYMPGCESLPKFWRIDTVLLSDGGSSVIIFEELLTCVYDCDTFSFIVKPLSSFKALMSSDLYFCAPLHSFENKAQLHVIPRYYNVW